MSVWSALERLTKAVTGAVAGLWSLIAGDRAATFSMAVVALSAKMARADGVVADVEVAVFERVFGASDADKPTIRRLFDLATGDVAGYEAYAAQIGSLFAEEPHMLEDVLDALFLIATADGAVHEAEQAFIARVADIFGIDAAAFRRLTARHVKPGRDDPFAILGLTASASDEDVKRRWRALARENHPDTMIARGVPADFVALATDRLARINGAYERIMDERAMREAGA
jgi:DnaJ like chaperone protein